jgi:hypothetical protein
MITRLILIYLGLFFSFAEPEPPHKCASPGDCLAHDGSRKDLPCEKRSDRWQRYQNATPAEREQMRARWREPMRDRILRIYEIEASQEKMIREEIDAIYASHCASMGAAFEEAERLDKAMSDYAVVFTKGLREGDDSVESEEAILRRLQDDLKYRALLERRRVIEGACQIDWNEALKRIEKLLPEAQVRVGRERLAIGLPHRCCKLWDEDATERERKERDRVKAIHPWEAHVQRFIERYKLNAGQIGAARSILREVREEAARVDRNRFDELARIHRRGDTAALRAHVEELELRTDDLFDQLNMRLDALLTTSQRQILVPVQRESTTSYETP